jgi:hypothetical protein
MQSKTWMRLGLSGVLLLGIAARSRGAEGQAKEQPVLEIMSLDKGDCTLRLSFRWGEIAVSHVMFNDHRAPFKAVVGSSRKGVQVSFDGWGDKPFVAFADRVRITYSVAAKKVIDFAADPIADRAVRVRAIDRPAMQGRRIVIRLDERASESVASVSLDGTMD